MRHFIRRNLFIVLGVSLPLALILLVLAIQAAHRWGVAPPTTPVLYVYEAGYYLHEHVDFDVVDGSLSARYRVPENRNIARQIAETPLVLAVFDPRDGSVGHHEVTIPRQDGVTDSEAVSLALPPALERLTLDPSLVSPEGFRFEVGRRARGGVFGELFGFGSHDMDYHLVRDRVEFDVPGQPAYGMQDGFIAWVEPE